MKKEFTANILFLIGINLLIKPFYALAIDTSVQNIVGPEAYGLFLAIFNFVYIQQIFADLGIQNFNNRNISRNPEQLVEQLPKILSSKILFTLGFITITLLTSWIFGYLQHFDEILVWVIASQATLSFLLYLRTNISGTGKYFTDSFISVLDKLILIIWMSYVIWVHPSLVLLMAGYSRMDGIMLEQILNDDALAAGKYARSFRLYDTVNNFTFLFAVLLLPMFSKMIKTRENVQELVTWAFKLLAMVSLFSIVMIYFRGEEILRLFYVNVDSGFPVTLFLLMIAGLALSLNYIYGTLLTANGNIRILNIGAAFATVLTQFLVLLLQVIFSYKYFKLNGSLANAIKLILTAAVSFGSFFALSTYWHLNLLICIVVSGALMLTCAFAIRYITVKDIVPSFYTFAE